ncbi:pyridoxamine phosphate oxidase [Xylogone sp. PMI_703]|nr:pyridoxamine phosphate oxidase [Xylogone sp. PMI_703]
MASEAQPPPHHNDGTSPITRQVTNTLPAEIVQTLQNARFLHLATCIDQFPHVSLMNYTYLPSSPYSTAPTIIMTTNPSSKKTHNLLANPHVSLLVHDWVSHRPPTTSATGRRSGSPPPEASRSSLASLLLNLNTAALSSISVTMNGEATLVEEGTEEERYYKGVHVENNTFDEESGGDPGAGGTEQDGGREVYIQGERVRVVVVRIRDARVADWKGGVRDWSLRSAEGEGGRNGLVNGY